jgi:hypothetical protein
MENLNLEKAIWTEVDFEKMGWHDSYVHAISFDHSYEFSLDIDYIFNWLQPTPENNEFNFSISPCTLIFEKVYNLKLNLEVSEPFELQIEDIIRHTSKIVDDIRDPKGLTLDEWEIETIQGSITFRAASFKQFVRQRPKTSNTQLLSLSDRAGISFERTTYL